METKNKIQSFQKQRCYYHLCSLFGLQATYFLTEQTHLLGIPKKHWHTIFRKPTVMSALCINGTGKAILQSSEEEKKGALAVS